MVAMGGAAGSAGMGAAGASGSASGDGDLGKGDGKDVVTIGDSWMNLLIAGIEPSLDKAAGQTYRHYAFPGTLVLNEQIPGQYETAKMQSPDIKTVVMTGGGNDILNSSCADTACNSVVDMVEARLQKLNVEMGMDNVRDVIIVGYTYPADMSKRESLDYSIMLSGQSCREDMMPRCFYLNSTKLNITLMSDGIHPDAASYDLIGQEVYKLMVAKGMRR
jgi:hypothetical protein